MTRIKDDKKEIDKDMIIIRNFIDLLQAAKDKMTTSLGCH